MQETPDILLFLGRFHPLIVHLPIGFLLMAFLLKLFSLRKNHEKLKFALPFTLFLGAISALFACILGYLLSFSGDYAEDALDTHFWFGIATTLAAFLAWALSAKKIKLTKLQNGKSVLTVLLFTVVLLTATGHYGGNLTHGSDYLTTYFPFGKKKNTLLPAPNSVQEAQVYGHLVAPILENKCLSCHNSTKKKGGLSFESSEAMNKGGKTGPVLIAGDTTKSQIIERVTMNPKDEKFMPPEGKTPLDQDEITLLKFWIAQGNGSFDTILNAVNPSEEIERIAAKLLGINSVESDTKELFPKVPEVSNSILNELRLSGFKIRELISKSNLFDISLPAGYLKSEEETTVLLQKLNALKQNILWLSLPENSINDNHLEMIGAFKNLKRLRLEKNKITDTGISHLINLENLEVLNLYQTQVSPSAIEKLLKIPSLKKVYIWETSISKKDVDVLDKDTLEFIL
ncbi:c-type cytochrome domain-containing protein [Croceitalea marina]|uniref:C-type cytochrome domain-containing protein n=1 Tax=Croceitalea marina TaxID=1775166 RepID=A0ABW5MVK4_9FLAO